jgi:hypothetical protein
MIHRELRPPSRRNVTLSIYHKCGYAVAPCATRWSRSSQLGNCHSGQLAGTIRIVLPPNERQEQFAAVVQRVDRLRDQQREADRQAEHLFQNLLHQAFSEKAESLVADLTRTLAITGKVQPSMQGNATPSPRP